MRSTRQRNVFLLVCFSLLLGTTSYAQPSRQGWTVSPMAGVYVFDSAPQGFDDGPVLGVRLAYLFLENWGVEGQLDYIDTDGEDKGDGNDDVTVFGAHLDLLYRFMPEEKLVPYLAFGGGGLIIKFDGQSHKVEDFFNYGAGLNYYIDDSMALRLDLRHILTYESDDWGNVGEQSFSAMAGVTFHLQKSTRKVERVDSDGDGVIGALDLCPFSPPGVSVDENGCAFEKERKVKRVDSDGDGLIDALDLCPSSPPGVSVDENGCAVEKERVVEGVDSDDDGIIDARDRCPSSPPGVSVDENGCAFDEDQDGVPNYRDICHGTLPKTPVNQVGCSENIKEAAGK